MLPSLIVIGAERCGTTSLHAYLSGHPQVFMSRQKELNFFVAELNWRRGRSWYEAQFPIAAAVRGESSPAYASHPSFTGVPERMSSIVPGARLVYLVRDPVERAASAYHLARAIGLEQRTPEDALRDPEASYTVRSRYATQLEQYLGHYRQEAILVVDSHDLLTRRQETLQRIFRFAGVDAGAPVSGTERELGTAKQRRRNLAGQALFRLGLKTIGDPRTRAVMRRAPHWAALALTGRTAPPLVGDSLRAVLEETLADEAARFRRLTGLAFDTWCV